MDEKVLKVIDYLKKEIRTMGDNLCAASSYYDTDEFDAQETQLYSEDNVGYEKTALEFMGELLIKFKIQDYQFTPTVYASLYEYNPGVGDYAYIMESCNPQDIIDHVIAFNKEIDSNVRKYYDIIEFKKLAKKNIERHKKVLEQIEEMEKMEYII